MKLNQYYTYIQFLKKSAELKELIQFSNITNNRISILKMDYFVYEYIVNLVEKWLSFLYIDEQEIIELRFFKRLNYNQIAIKLNYSNHSCALKKTEAIVEK